MQTEFVKGNTRFTFSSSPRRYGYNRFGRYLIQIQVYDIILNRLLFHINSDEKSFFRVLNDMFDFTYEDYSDFSDHYIYFDPDQYGNQYVINITLIPYAGPTEDDYIEFKIFYVNLKNGLWSPKYHETWSIYDLENLVYQGWLIIQDIPYITDIQSSLLVDLLEGDI